MHSYAWTALRTIESDPQPSDYIITTSSGSTVTVIPLVSDFVLQIFRSKDIYLRVLQFWKKIQKYDLQKFIARIISYNDKLNMIKVQKVNPLNNFSYGGADISGLDITSLEKEVISIIEQLGEYGLVQGDTRLDNIGTYNGHYVLFDYDNAKIDASIKDIEHNIRIFQKSLSLSLNLKL